MQEEDDIVFKGCPVLPKVIFSPLRKDKKMKTEKLSEEAENSEQQEDADISENSKVSEEEYECDSDIDPTWYDSDYGMEEDDEEYDKNVDAVVHDALIEKGKSIGAEYRYVSGTDDVYEDDLQLPKENDWDRKHKSDSDDEEYKKKKRRNPFIGLNHLTQLLTWKTLNSSWAWFLILWSSLGK